MDRREAEALFPFIGHRYRPLSDLEVWGLPALTHSAFCRVTALGQQFIPEIATDMPRKGERDPIFVYVARHRSEFDYALLLCTLCQVGKYAITQAGDNLFIGPLDTYLRKKGAFKVLRFREGETKSFYHPKWIRNRICRTWSRLPLLPKALKSTPATLDRESYRELYHRYMVHLVREGYDLQIFPEYDWSASGKKRVGRSKTGLLNPFAPAVFASLLAAQEETGRPVFVVPVSVTYERVPEDTNIRRIQTVREYLSRKLHLGPAIGSAASYGFDFAYNLALCLPGFNLVPRPRRPAAVIHLGAPYRLCDPEGASGKAAEELHLALADLHPKGEPAPASEVQPAERAAAVAWERVGALEVPYVSQLVAYSALELLMAGEWHSLMRQVFGQEGGSDGYGEGLPESYTVPLGELRVRYEANYRKLCEGTGSIHEVVGLEGGPVPVEEALSEMDRIFSNRLLLNPIFDHDASSLVVNDLPTFVQYANHVLHLFRPPCPPTKEPS